MDDTTLRLRARVTILKQLTVRLFGLLSPEHAPQIREAVADLDRVVEGAKGSELFGADLTPEAQNDLYNMTKGEWAWTKAQILDPLR